jgi:hypothetical protein
MRHQRKFYWLYWALLMLTLPLSGCLGGGGSSNSTGTGAGTGTSSGTGTAVTWSTVNSPTTNTLYSVIWTGNNFVALGDRVKATSTDGINWTAQASTFSIDSAAWDGTKFVGLSRGIGTCIIRTSTDGIVWTDRLNVGSTGGSIDTAMIWANNKFFALGKDSTGATTSYISSDGISWTTNTNNTAATFHSVIWDGNQYVAVGNLVSGSTSIASKSPDGITWQSVTLPTTNTLQSIAYNGTRYVVTSPGVTSVAYTTTDGISWTKVTPGSIDFGERIIWAGNKFIGVGYWWRVMSSPDGMTWSEETSSGTTYAGMYSNLHDIAYSGTRYAAVGYSGQIMFSN